MQLPPRVAPKSPCTKRWTSADGVWATATGSPVSSSVVAKKTWATATATTMVKRSEASLRAIPHQCTSGRWYGQRTNLGDRPRRRETVAVNLPALWPDLECAGYREDLPFWRSLAAETGGPVLDVGAGTGRVSLDLAARGIDVVAVDTEAALLAALEHRAGGLPVQTLVADARRFTSERRFALIIVPMQTLQLLGGSAGREAFLRRARKHLLPGGRVAAALADAMDCFDAEHDSPPPPDALEIVDVRYASQLRAVVEDGERAALHRRREVVGPHGREHDEDVVLQLDRVSADTVEAEAARLGFGVEARRRVPETEQYL